jgi:hypothetical protein
LTAQFLQFKGAVCLRRKTSSRIAKKFLAYSHIAKEKVNSQHFSSAVTQNGTLTSGGAVSLSICGFTPLARDLTDKPRITLSVAMFECPVLATEEA